MNFKSASVVAAMLLAGCATPGSYSPPWSATVGFFGAQVTVAQPGYEVPAKVMTSADVTQPTLLVPANAPVTSGIVPVTTASGVSASVPVKVATVTQPVLAVPMTGSVTL